MRRKNEAPAAGSLVVVGTGIKLGAHATVETVTEIGRASCRERV